MNISHLWKAPAGEWLQENWTQFAISFENLPSGKLLHNYGKPASLIILIGKSTIHGPFHQRVDSTWFSDNRRRPCGSCQSKPAAAPKESASVPRLGSRGKNHGGFPNGKKNSKEVLRKNPSKGHAHFGNHTYYWAFEYTFFNHKLKSSSEWQWVITMT